MKANIFNNLIVNISSQTYVSAILLVGSRACNHSQSDSDYDIHVITETDIPTFTLHYQKPLRMDMTCYYIENIKKLDLDRALEINEAEVLYQKNQNVKELFSVISSNRETDLHWIRFHLRHLEEDMLRSKNKVEMYLHRTRYLYHECKYKHILKSVNFRGFIRLNWNTKDYHNFT